MSFPPRSSVFDPGLLLHDQALHERRLFLLVGLRTLFHPQTSNPPVSTGSSDTHHCAAIAQSFNLPLVGTLPSSLLSWFLPVERCSMKRFSGGSFPRGLFLVWIIIGIVPITLPQAFAPRPSRDTAVPASQPVRKRQRALPDAVLCCGNEIDYLGAYSSDGKFRTTPRIDRDNVRVRGRNSPSGSSRDWLRPSEVPPFIDLHPRERVEENYEPPARAVKPAKGKSPLALLRDDIVTLAYGRERILLAPHRVTVDSRGRILIVDPNIRAVHVLGGGNPFRIDGGPRRRLRLPNGIAVDAADNIYIADSERGLVLVYAPDGKFLRYIGKRGDESLFHYPTAIAIDRTSGRLFLLDTPRHVLFVLDLEGNILKRVGRPRPNAIGRVMGESIPMDLDYPTEIAIGNNELVVVDSANSRIHVMDLQCKPVAQFSIRAVPGPPIMGEVGLGLDLTGNIYVSNTTDSHIRVYGPDGTLLGSFGRNGMEVGEFNSPAGLCVDGRNRLYISDTNNSRVQVFQLSHDSEIETELRATR
jgi:sugar lactone lactonase YvrE